MARLIAQTGHSFDIPTHGVTFGSDPANDVMIPQAYGLAPSHFAIWPQGEGYCVRDSGSGYGLWINGQQVKESMLSHGDTLVVGQLQLLFEQAIPVLKRAPGFQPNGIAPLSPESNALPSRTARYDFAEVVNQPSPRPEPVALPMLEMSNPPPPAPPAMLETRSDSTPESPRSLESASKPLISSSSELPLVDAMFEVLPADSSSKGTEDDTIRLEPAARIRGNDAPAFGKSVAPNWLPPQMPEPPPPLSGVTNRMADHAHREKITGNHLLRAAKWGLLVALLAAAATTKHWGQQYAKHLEGFFSAVFTNESPWNHPESLQAKSAIVSTELIHEAQSTAPLTRVDITKPHVEVAPRFIWDQATTVFSLGFPQIEIFYLNQAQQQGLPLPKRHSTYLEKHFGVKISDLERITSIQSDPEKPGIVVISTQKRSNANEWISAAEVREESTETIGSLQLLRYSTPQGQLCGLVALDDRNFAIGDPDLIRRCLQRKSDPFTSPTVAAMWPDFLRKQPGAFLWTIRQDAQLEAQLAASERPSKPIDTKAISSFAVRFGGEPPRCECFAIRDQRSSPESFADAANESLRGMVHMMTSQIESSGVRRSNTRDVPSIDVARNAATVELRRGEEFVNIFLQGFYAPALADEGPLKALAKARTLAHAFNLARSMDAPESRRVRTVEEALEALQKGMSGSGRAAAMEFQIQEMDADEMRQMRNYLTFADGYLACRPDLESIPENIRALAEEGRDRLNAETVLSLCPAPSAERVVKIPDLAGYIRKSLANLRSTRGAMSLFGMPQLLDEELKGVLKYVTQLPNGRLGWKPGELAFNAWQAKSNPKAQRDAATLASIAGAAHAAGAQELVKAATVAEAIEILATGVKGTGQFSSTLFRCKDLTQNDIQAAAGLLVLDQGLLKMKDNYSSEN